ncbi:MAG: YaiO family outer membrane beta-barrel protein, partial [Gammaproteobacteria bacterium]|nr:YaiO family outer membrane beta-barrel protein [Gammaproteobacteria bacterium]
YFNAYTASIGKYIGSYYIQFRPTYYVGSSGPSSLLYTLTLQKYFSAEEYIGFMISEGTAPDLANLNTSSLLKTDFQTYMFSGQHVINKQFAMQYGIGESIENFGNNNIRHYTYINGGLSFRDV